MIHQKASAKMENLLDLNELCDSENISVTQLDFLPTQDLFKFDLPENKRFEAVVSDEQLKKRKDDRIPKNTRKQNCWAVSCYQDWAKWRNTRAETLVGDSGSVPIDLSTQSLMTIDYWLSRFIIECRRRDGKPYPPATLYNIATSIQRELREVHGRADVNILDSRDVYFAEFRKQLDSRMKELTNEGVGIHKERADPVSEQDELQLWETEVIGHNSAKALSYGVFFYNCKVFGFRGGDEHRNLDVSQYTLTTESGRKVLTFKGRNSKNVQGGLNQRRVEPKKIKQYESTDNQRCIVKLFEKYIQCIPSSGPFYRKPLQNSLSGDVMFSSQNIGINTLGKYMKSMFSDAGIDATGRNIRNHSGKVTLCTRMYEQIYDEQAIMNRSGHRSTAVRSYKRPSEEMLQRVSDSLQPPTSTLNEPKVLPQSPNVPLSSPTVTDKKFKTDTILPSKSQELAQNSIEINVPETITTVIINKCGRKISINL